MKQHNVVCTNPPFSRLNHYVQLVMSYDKDIILIMNMMALMYSNIKDYAMNGMFNYINRFSGGATFKRPNGDIVQLTCIGITTLKSLERTM